MEAFAFIDVVQSPPSVPAAAERLRRLRRAPAPLCASDPTPYHEAYTNLLLSAEKPQAACQCSRLSDRGVHVRGAHAHADARPLQMLRFRLDFDLIQHVKKPFFLFSGFEFMTAVCCWSHWPFVLSAATLEQGQELSDSGLMFLLDLLKTVINDTRATEKARVASPKCIFSRTEFPRRLEG